MPRQSDASGNKGRRGRPKGSPNTATIARKIANERVTIRDANGSRSVTVLEAVILKVQQHAIRGNLAADRRLDQLRLRLGLGAQSGKAGLLVVPGTQSEEEWIRQETLANLYRDPPEELAAPGPVTPAIQKPEVGPALGGTLGKIPAPRLPRQLSPRVIR